MRIFILSIFILSSFAGLSQNKFFLRGKTIVPSYDQDVSAVFSYATTEGYTLPSTHTKNSFNQFVLNLKSRGIYSRLKYARLFATDGDLDFALIDIISPGRGTFSGTLTQTSKVGVSNPSKNAYINTQFTPSTSLSLNNQTYGAYLQSVVAENVVVYGSGTSQSASNVVRLIPISGSTAFWQISTSQDTRYTVVTYAASKMDGLFVNQLRGGNRSDLFFKAGLETTVTPTIGSISSFPLYNFAFNANNTVGAYSGNTVASFIFAGDTLTQDQVTDLNFELELYLDKIKDNELNEQEISISATDTIDVWILAGQSNALGLAELSDASTDYLTRQANIIINLGDGSNSPDGEWRRLKIGENNRQYAGSDPNGFGLEISLMQRLSDTKPQHVIKVSRGGTGLYNTVEVNWNISQATGMWSILRNEIRQFKRAYSRRYEHINWRGVIWVQGEKDASVEAHALQYEANLTDLINSVRTEVGEDLPWINVKLNTSTSYPYKTEVNGAMDAIAIDLDNIYNLNSPTGSLGPDNVHYDADGYEVLADSLVEIIATTSDFFSDVSTDQTDNVISVSFTTNIANQNQPPSIELVTISGDEIKEDTLFATVSGYYSPGGYPEGDHIFAWYRADNQQSLGTVISGATDSLYVFTTLVLLKALRTKAQLFKNK